MELLTQIHSFLDADRAHALNHPFFSRFSKPKSNDQVKRFAKQWYLAARSHKQAFPHLVAITKDDDTRRELIEVLRDEYGNGDPKKIHARLLENFLSGLGIAPLSTEIMIPEIVLFARTTLAMWRDTDSISAFGYHYALEYVAQDIHKVFFDGLQTCGLPIDSLEYFAYHSTAEEEHVAFAKTGFNRYADDAGNHKSLITGIETGTQALAGMWDGFERYVFV